MSRDKQRRDFKGFVYLAKEFGIYPGELGRLKRALSFFFANNYLPRPCESNNNCHLLGCGLKPAFSGRHFTETVLSLQGRDDFHLTDKGQR